MKLQIIDIYKDESYVPTEPVSLSEAKAWCLVDFTDDDTLITSLITRSRHAVEDYCNISICPKTITLTAMFCSDEYYAAYPFYPNWKWDANFYGYPIAGAQFTELPWGPVSTVGSVTMINQSTATILTADTDYFLAGQLFKQIKIVNWAYQAVIVYYTPYYCPDALKESILAEIAFAYENRGNQYNKYRDQSIGLSQRSRELADPYQRRWY